MVRIFGPFDLFRDQLALLVIHLTMVSRPIHRQWLVRADLGAFLTRWTNGHGLRPILAAIVRRMMILLAAAILWVFVHVGIAGTAVRASLAQRFGEVGFRIGYSIVSVVSITLLVMAWQAAPVVPLWFIPDWFRWVTALLMLPALLLFVASVATSNPTAVEGKLDEAGPRGIQRITRHPMLWSFSIWAGLHLLTSGNLAGVLFFGAFLVTSLVGMPSIDRKLAERQPDLWARLAPGTSIIPFKAILGGRNRLALEEIPKLVWIIGVVAWLGLLFGHAWLFGRSALPY